MSDLLAVLEVECLDLRFVLCLVRNCVSLVTHPLVDIGGVTIFDDPDFCEYSSEFPTGIGFFTS